MTGWEVVQVRTGKVLSWHKTEGLAWEAYDRYLRLSSRRANRPGYVGGGYGQVEIAIRECQQGATNSR